MNFSRYNNYIKINPANTGATKKRLFHSHHIFCLLSPLHFSQNISHASWSISNNHQQIGLEIPFDKFLLRLAAVFKTPPQQFSKLCSYGFFSIHFFFFTVGSSGRVVSLPSPANRGPSSALPISAVALPSASSFGRQRRLPNKDEGEARWDARLHWLL